MSTETNSQTETSIKVADSPFLKALVQQIRAQDTFGTYSKWKDELVLSPFVVTKERKKKISLDKEIDPATHLRIISFYRAIAAVIEQETGTFCQVIVNLNSEGFGYAFIWSGRLIVVNKSMRDAQRFGFNSLEKLAERAERLIKSGLDAIDRFPEAAKA